MLKYRRLSNMSASNRIAYMLHHQNRNGKFTERGQDAGIWTQNLKRPKLTSSTGIQLLSGLKDHDDLNLIKQLRMLKYKRLLNI